MICMYGWPSLGKTSAFDINVHIGKDEPVAVAKSSNQKKKKKKRQVAEETRSMLCHRNPEKRMFHETVNVDNKKCYKK